MNIISCEIESSEVIALIRYGTDKKEVVSYTIHVIDALLKELVASDIIKRYRIYENDN